MFDKYYIVSLFTFLNFCGEDNAKQITIWKKIFTPEKMRHN